VEVAWASISLNQGTAPAGGLILLATWLLLTAFEIYRW
jgi:hypothetical protein